MADNKNTARQEVNSALANAGSASVGMMVDAANSSLKRREEARKQRQAAEEAKRARREAEEKLADTATKK